MNGAIQTNADADADARRAIWRAICYAADVLLAGRCSMSFSPNPGTSRPVHEGEKVPDVRTFRLVEGLSLLTLLARADEVHERDVCLFSKAGPLKIREDRVIRYVWVQPSVFGQFTDFLARPDLCVTSDADPPRPANVVYVIEVKSIRQFGAQLVRAEFGKAHDLRVGTYFIWTFYAPTATVVAGAKNLGLDVVEIGFDTPRRQDLVTDSAALVSYVAHAQEEAKRAQRFARHLEEAAEQAQLKLSGPRR